MDFVIDPYETRYKWFLNSENELKCDHSKNSDLQTSLCECDAKFAMDMGAVWSDSTWDEGLWEHRRNLNYSLHKDAVCVNQDEMWQVKNDDCCGDYGTFLVKIAK